MGSKNVSEKTATPTPQPVSNGNVTTEEKSTAVPTYVVVREGFRVSDNEYLSATDPVALSEQQFWNKIAKEHSYGEPVVIVKYDAKLHRVW